MISLNQVSKVFPESRKASRKKNATAARRNDPRQTDDGFAALQGVSFSCGKGETLALLGANGAGKTTLLRLLAGILEPTEGEITIGDERLTPQHLELRRAIGMLSNTTALYRRLTSDELLRYYGRLYDLDEAAIDQRIAFLADLLELDTFLERRVDTLSTGMKQRLAFARALIHDPQVLILDEPTTGMDVMSANVVTNFVQRCRDDGKAILIATHNMSEVSFLCHRAVVLNHGRVVFDGSVSDLRARATDDRLETALTDLVSSVIPLPTTTTEVTRHASAQEHIYGIR